MTIHERRPLQAVGFWCDPMHARMRAIHGAGDPYVTFLRECHEEETRSGKPFLPDPDRILAILGPIVYEESVTRYLESGRVVGQYLGFSTCRCCGVSGPDLGSEDLTDGTWVWPEGLAHYLRSHHLPLPQHFLQTMADNQYHVPRPRRTESAELASERRDYAFWHRWSAEVYGGERRG